MTYFIRFSDEITGIAALKAAGLLTEDNTPILASHTHALDVIGIIMRGGEYDEDGNVLVPPTVLDGWHVNYIGELPDDWDQYVVHPTQPVRVWA
jgi:hypothetical protein